MRPSTSLLTTLRRPLRQRLRLPRLPQLLTPQGQLRGGASRSDPLRVRLPRPLRVARQPPQAIRADRLPRLVLRSLLPGALVSESRKKLGCSLTTRANTTLGGNPSARPSPQQVAEMEARAKAIYKAPSMGVPRTRRGPVGPALAKSRRPARWSVSGHVSRQWALVQQHADEPDPSTARGSADPAPTALRDTKFRGNGDVTVGRELLPMLSLERLSASHRQMNICCAKILISAPL